MTASPPIPPADLEALDELRGPLSNWEKGREGHDETGGFYTIAVRGIRVAEFRFEEDRTYVLALVDAHLALSAELRALRAENAELKEALKRIRDFTAPRETVIAQGLGFGCIGPMRAIARAALSQEATDNAV